MRIHLPEKETGRNAVTTVTSLLSSRNIKLLSRERSGDHRSSFTTHPPLSVHEPEKTKLVPPAESVILYSINCTKRSG